MGLPSAESLRARIPDVNDGIVAVAGVVQGLLAAGAGYDALVAASAVATIAGGASLAGTTYAGAAADRDAELALIREELTALESDPEAELEELAAYYRERGVEPDLAREVARQVTAHDALTAQLESEYGIREPTPRSGPILEALGAALAFGVGGGVPILIIATVPWWSRGAVTAIAVILSLTLTAIVSARLGHASVWRTIARSIVVAVLAMTLALLAGQFLPDPDGGGRAYRWPAGTSEGPLAG